MKIDFSNFSNEGTNRSDNNFLLILNWASSIPKLARKLDYYFLGWLNWSINRFFCWCGIVIEMEMVNAHVEASLCYQKIIKNCKKKSRLNNSDLFNLNSIKITRNKNIQGVRNIHQIWWKLKRFNSQNQGKTTLDFRRLKWIFLDFYIFWIIILIMIQSCFALIFTTQNTKKFTQNSE